MIKTNKLGQSGITNVLLLPVILLSLFFIAAASFAVWAYGGRQDYKNNVDAKIQTAVLANKQVVQAADAKLYAEAAKNPLKTYIGPDAFGSVHITYPKTWSTYIDTTDSGTPLNAYFHTDYVPSTNDQSASYNLHVQVIASAYNTVLDQYNGQIQEGTATAKPYALPKLPKIIGTRLDGQLFDNDGVGSIVLLPLRDKTLELSIQSNSYQADFNNIILPNASFSP